MSLRVRNWCGSKTHRHPTPNCITTFVNELEDCVSGGPGIPAWAKTIETGTSYDLVRTNLLDPNISHGTAGIKGTRIVVSVILDNLADGVSTKRILQNYPTLKLEDIHFAIAYASELTRERIVTFDEVTT